MVAVVALLRGVNVGGKGKVAMAELRAAAVSLGYGRVETYIQSGNLVCDAPNPATVADELAAALATALGAAPAVTVRTGPELEAVVAANPFPSVEPRAVHVLFGLGPDPVTLDLDPAPYRPDEAIAVGRELFLCLPAGIGRSKLAADLGRRGPPGTVRNWRTVTTLLEMVRVDGFG